MTQQISSVHNWHVEPRAFVMLTFPNAVFYGRKKYLGITDNDMYQNPDICLDTLQRAAAWLGDANSASRA